MASLERAEKLAQEHWEYIEKLLKTHGEKEEIIRKIGFHYKTAFKHGYKHALEDMPKWLEGRESES